MDKHYFVVARAIESGGHALVGFGERGLRYVSFKGPEMRFYNEGSANNFRAFAASRIDLILGQTGDLVVLKVRDIDTGD